jgi:hypothetical protein
MSSFVVAARRRRIAASALLSLLAVAQDSAIVAAIAQRGATTPLDHAVAVAASFEVLKSIYPLETAFLDSVARGDLADPLWTASATRSVGAGDTLGRQVAARIVARRGTDGSAAAGSAVRRRRSRPFGRCGDRCSPGS